MTVLPFGIISSPAILIQVVERIVKSIKNDNSGSLLIDASFMDDIILQGWPSSLIV